MDTLKFLFLIEVDIVLGEQLLTEVIRNALLALHEFHELSPEFRVLFLDPVHKISPKNLEKLGLGLSTVALRVLLSFLSEALIQAIDQQIPVEIASRE